MRLLLEVGLLPDAILPVIVTKRATIRDEKAPASRYVVRDDVKD